MSTGIAPLVLTWRARDVPLEPAGVLGTGRAARPLVERLLRLEDITLNLLQGGANRDVVVVLGPRESLPWVPGLMYLGRDPHAPNLYLPTTSAPEFPLEELQKALAGRFSRTPLALLPPISTVFPLDTVRPLVRNRLEAWLNGEI